MEISTRSQLIQDLENSFQAIINWINEQPESHFNKIMVEGKWSIAGHLYHLLKSTKAVTQGMKMPKLGLRTMFGKCNRTERTYDEIVEKYHNVVVKNSFKTLSAYEAESGRTFERSALIQRFESELNDFIKAFEKWKDTDISVYVMLHPAIGKLTIREFVLFTTLHTNHHLNILKKDYTK
ncbi:MAG: DinB family protein [Saprospiraceae bacterium]